MIPNVNNIFIMSSMLVSDLKTQKVYANVPCPTVVSMVIYNNFVCYIYRLLYYSTTLLFDVLKINFLSCVALHIKTPNVL